MHKVIIVIMKVFSLTVRKYCTTYYSTL